MTTLSEITRRLLTGTVALALAASLQLTPTAAAEAGTPLQEAFAFMPAEPWELRLTDWATMRAAHGVGVVTSMSPMDERRDLVNMLKEQEAPVTSLGLVGYQLYADVLGWDVTDLDWSATLAADEAFVDVLHFRADMDLAPVRQILVDHGLTVTSYRDVQLYAQSYDEYIDEWQRPLLRPHLAMAFMPDGRTIVIGSPVMEASEPISWFPVVVDAYLDGVEPNLEAQAMARLVDRLGSPSSAILLAPACNSFRPLRLTDAEAAVISAALPLATWHAIGVATYRTEAADHASGVFILDFPDEMASQAATDLHGRTRLLDIAHTSLYTVDATALDGSAIVVEVTPVEDQPHRIMLAADERDAAFAMC